MGSIDRKWLIENTERKYTFDEFERIENIKIEFEKFHF